MSYSVLKEMCSVNTDSTGAFVGLSFEEEAPKIQFPIGYDLSDSEDGLRQDIQTLLKVLLMANKSKDEKIVGNMEGINFPINSYYNILLDYYKHGYHYETECFLKKSTSGAISWQKTIKCIRPWISNSDPIYLEFITRSKRHNENSLISDIHRYCVSTSYKMIGWIFPKKINLDKSVYFNYKLFKKELIRKFSSTFNESDRFLFRNMLSIIECQKSSGSLNYIKFGTNRFEYIWEWMIDKIYGVPKSEKQMYYPNAFWKINGDICSTSSLRPDTIMKIADNFYILDAKYYRYGITHNPTDLPNSDSIQKQVTYGEHIHLVFKDKMNIEEIYNAFIIPFNGGSSPQKIQIMYIGEAQCDWKKGDHIYEHVGGILIDTKYLMNSSIACNKDCSRKLADVIDENIFATL